MSTIQKPTFKERYDNYIGGKFTAPVLGKYFDNISPIDGKVFTQAAHSSKEDIDLAVEAAILALIGSSSLCRNLDVLSLNFPLLML